MDAHFASAQVPLFMLAPFFALLLAIAMGPVYFPAWWQRHYAKAVFAPALFVALYYCLAMQGMGRVVETAEEYFSFIVLIGSLFVVSGGIHIQIEREATPLANVVFLFIGAVAANLLGTTGASMLLIRPWLGTNRRRIAAYHVAFFIFIVSNVGGCLTPVADPPLFLGYLMGVPFWWVTRNCLPMWCTGVGILLAMFYAVDRWNYNRTPKAKSSDRRMQIWGLDGLHNLLYIVVILGATLIQRPPFLREGLMLGAAAASWLTTRKSIYRANQFDLHPIREVAVLFAGIFSTMMPPMDWMRIHAESLSRADPAILYAASGAISSVLDNAPTYVCFFKAMNGPVINWDILSNQRLIAISVGAVFFGANSYLGNGPNLMVRTVAIQQNAPAPTFAGFIVKYTMPFMLPMLLAVGWLFFR